MSTNTPTTASNQFEVRPPEYLERFDVFRQEVSFQQIIGAVEKATSSITDSLVVCDAMSGTGKVGNAIREAMGERIREILFVDGSSKMLEATNTDPRDKKVLCDCEDLPFDDDTIHALVSRYGINNVEKHQYPKIISEYLRTTTPDGVIVIQDHFPTDARMGELINTVEAFIAKEDGRNDNPYIATTNEFREITERSGGQVVRQEAFVYTYSVKERFNSKGKKDIDLSPLKAKIAPFVSTGLFQIQDDDIIFHYPITTFSIQKTA